MWKFKGHAVACPYSLISRGFGCRGGLEDLLAALGVGVHNQGLAGHHFAVQRLKSIYQKELAALEELKKSLLHQAFSAVARVSPPALQSANFDNTQRLETIHLVYDGASIC